MVLLYEILLFLILIIMSSIEEVVPTLELDIEKNQN